MIGIYKITNPIGEIYIGKSINIEKRKAYYINGQLVTKNRLEKLKVNLKKWKQHLQHLFL